MNNEKQLYDPDKEEPNYVYDYYRAYIKDLPIYKENEDVPVLTWTITTNTELSIRLKLKLKVIDEVSSKVNDHVIHSKTTVRSCEKKSSFMDRLKMFDNKDKPKPSLEKKSFTMNNDSDITLNAEQQEIVNNNKECIYEINSSKFEEQIPKGYTRDCFCEGFFIASFPKVGGSVIEKSQEYPSTCGHTQCSMLPAMQSEIIARYPLEDTKTLELNNLAATICFPTGIKVCYEEQDPITVKNYSTPITNQQGERYYMMTYHFYFRMLNSQYSKSYEMHPLKHHLMRFGDGYLGLDKLDKKTTETIQENLELCQELGFREVVYVPYCLCLISKYPYIKQMEKCLQSIYCVISDFSSNSAKDINDIILFLIKSLPVPMINTKIKFYLPFSTTGVELICPKYKDMSILNYNLSSLLRIFTIDDIIRIFKLMLFERKILFVDKEYNRLSEVTDSFISLLYPFQWIHTYIPIMSDQMIKYLETFLPFVNGISESLMPIVRDTLIENEDEVYIIYVYNKEISANLAFKKKKFNVRDHIDKTVPSLPKHLQKKLQENLKKIKKQIDERSGNIENSSEMIDMSIKNAFIEIIAEMFHDYKKYLINLDEDDVVFNGNSFVENRSKEDNLFYREFIETQLFQQFTQNVLKEDFTHFNSMAQAIETNTKIDNQLMESKLKIEKSFLIRPRFFRSKETEELLIDKEIAKNHNDSSYENGMLKESKRILDRMNEITKEGFQEKQNTLYLIPGEYQRMLSEKMATLKKQESGNKISMRVQFFQSAQQQNRIKGRNELSDKDKDQITETIKDVLGCIFKSEEIIGLKGCVNKEIFQKMKISTEFGCNLFVNILSKNKGDVKTLNTNSFDLLLFLIYQLLLDIMRKQSEENLKNFVLLLKSSMCYCKFDKEKKKDKNILLYDVLCEKLNNYTFLFLEATWFKWLEIEIKERKVEKNASEIEKILFEYIYVQMRKFNLENNYIKELLENSAKKFFAKTEEEFFNVRDKIVGIISAKN